MTPSYITKSATSLLLYSLVADLNVNVSGFTFTPTTSSLSHYTNVGRISNKPRISSTFLKDTQSSKEEILEEANEALASVGWSRPMEDAEMTSDDPFVQRIDAQIQQDFGVGLDELLNPAKVSFMQRIFLCLFEK